MESTFPEKRNAESNIINIDESYVIKFLCLIFIFQEENKENNTNNVSSENYLPNHTNEKNKKITYDINGEKLKKKRKDYKNRKKLALLGYDKPNSSLNSNLCDIKSIPKLSFDTNNKIYNPEKNNIIKAPDIINNININKKELISKNKTKIFRIDKISKPIIIQKNSPKKEKRDYCYLNFDFENSQENISFVGEYLEEIYLNLLLEEKQTIIKPKYGYMKDQSEINEIMRAILIDWLIDVHLRFNLRQETLFMTVWLIDAYLSYAFILREKLQLLGITCLLISCKSHEIYYPQHKKFIEMTDGAYTKEEMLKMENEILKKLNFYVVYPNTYDFYNILSKMFKFERKHYYLGKYFIESALIDYQMIKYSSSVIAASCAYLVMKYYGIQGYQKLYNNFIVNDKSPEDAIKDTAKEVYVMVDNLSKSKLKAVKNKYSMEQFEKVGEIIQEKYLFVFKGNVLLFIRNNFFF